MNLEKLTGIRKFDCQYQGVTRLRQKKVRNIS